METHHFLPHSKDARMQASRGYAMMSHWVFVWGPDIESSMHLAYYAGMAY
jgi:ribulose-5-phosphate 4-epimerase/fuculose-1-phosphate aldolase